MSNKILQTDIDDIVQKYSDMLFRIALVMLKNPNDAEDAVQETFLKYFQKEPVFNNDNHKKAWFIKVITNKCIDVQRFNYKHPKIDITELNNYVSNSESCGIIDALMEIPDKFKIVMLLYYIEEYKVEEIANIIGKSTSAVKMRLQKGRKLLEQKYIKEYM